MAVGWPAHAPANRAEPKSGLAARTDEQSASVPGVLAENWRVMPGIRLAVRYPPGSEYRPAAGYSAPAWFPARPCAARPPPAADVRNEQYFPVAGHSHPCAAAQNGITGSR
ncbi:hypothetical protein D3C78_1119140 [compost metagenome]